MLGECGCRTQSSGSKPQREAGDLAALGLGSPWRQGWGGRP